MISRVDQYFDFIIVNTNNAALHKYVVQNGRSMFRAISKTVGNSVLHPSQNSFNYLLGNLSFKPVSLYNLANSS